MKDDKVYIESQIKTFNLKDLINRNLTIKSFDNCVIAQDSETLETFILDMSRETTGEKS